MKKEIICLGSINIDQVFTVKNIVRAGETINSTACNTYPGGKGSNQSVAIARSSATCHHIGKIGTDGSWVKELMNSSGVDTTYIQTTTLTKSGKAIIQVSEITGDNAIILFPGANQTLQPDEIITSLNNLCKTINDGILLLQNELDTNSSKIALTYLKNRNFIVCLNAAPCPSSLNDLIDLYMVDILILNEIEAGGISKLLGLVCETVQETMDAILKCLDNLVMCLVTLGGNGVLLAIQSGSKHSIHEFKVERKVVVVDTTGAGDTFVGYFIGGISKLIDFDIKKITESNIISIKKIVKESIIAAGISCESKGAMSSIPTKALVDRCK
jgi:ribokinase